MFGKYLALCASAAMMVVVPAHAKSSSSAKKRDPNEVVCERTEVVGSRLAKQKVCMTRAEWAEKKRLERIEIDRAQTARGSCDGCQ